LGPNHAIIWSHNDRSLYRFDYQTGDTVLLASEEPGGIVSHRAVPSPFDERTALLTVDYDDGLAMRTTLGVFDASGAVVSEYDLPDEGGSDPIWLSETRIAVQTYESGETAILRIVDMQSGLIQEIPGFAGWDFAVGNGMVFGISSGHVHFADLETRESKEMAVLASESAWEFVTLTEAPPPGSRLDTDVQGPTLATTPPLQQTDIVPIAVATPETVADSAPPVEATQEVPAATTSSTLWWVLGVAGLAGAATIYARATRSNSSSSK
jgi:hypothetical protein